MNDLFAASPARRRAPFGTGVSIVLHFVVSVGAVSVEQLNSSRPRVMVASPPVFVFTHAMPIVWRIPSVPLRVAQTRLTPPKRDEAQATIEPAIARESVRPLPVLERMVARRRPPVIDGTSASTATVAQAVAATREIVSAGFDPPMARAPQLKVGGVRAGAFDVPAGAAHPQPGVDRPAQGVVVGGFGNARSGVAPASSPSGGVVAEAGFPGAERGSNAPVSGPVQVRAGGFDVQTAAPTPRPHELFTTPRLDTPVEVVSKPAPDYTEEARALRVEGDVLLQVEFTAQSQVRVLRVVRGLGHGLDEAAIRAAEHIRFKPAQGGGRPIDFQTTVHIVFRLT
jgi:TonB family protein